MSEAERLRETRRWLRYAHQDLVAAEAMLGRSDSDTIGIPGLVAMELRTIQPYTRDYG